MHHKGVDQLVVHVDIVHEATIHDLIAVRAGLTPLRGLHFAPTPQRRWQKDGHDVYCLQIVLMGKTGYGKSTFANTFCGRTEMKTSAVDACTRRAASYEYALTRDSYLSLVDLPGVGESREQDAGYLKLYREMIEKSDVILYLMRADQRDYSVDEGVFTDLFPAGTIKEKMIIILNGCDKIEPLNRQESTTPSPQQQENIAAKISSVRALLPHDAPIVPCSANTGWNLPAVEQALLKQLKTYL
jgi:predicted GTPase